MAAKRQFQLFASAARTTHTNSPEVFLNDEAGFRITFNITAFSGTSIVFTIQYYEESAGSWNTLLATAALSATGLTVLHVDPRIATAANASLQAIPPKRIRVVPSGTITSVTYGATFTGGS